jgi:Holliday junction resolvasome RuvABC endonuclease subunit
LLLPGGILALDLAGIVGWAYGHLRDQAPRFGTWVLPHHGGEGARYAAFENEMAAAMDQLRPSRVMLEAPLSFQALMGVSNFRVMAQQYTLRGIAYAEAWRASCPIGEVSADLVRRELLGRGHFAKDTVKREVLRWCLARGWRVPDHNAGDAAMVWQWLVTQLRSDGSGPLFVKPTPMLTDQHVN